MANELELKLAATPEKLLKIKNLNLPGIDSQTPWETRNLDNTYYDTQGFKLRELGIGMRIRKIGDQLIQTVKSSGKTIGGISQRSEDEIEVGEDSIDISLISDPYLQVLIEEANEEDGDFLPCFKTQFERTQCHISFSDGTKIEIALDSGNIKAENNDDNKDNLVICEVELELIEGSADYLFALGRYLIKELNLTLYNASKARRGYSLCKDYSAEHLKLKVTELSQGIESEKAFEKICFIALKHWQHYELSLIQEDSHFAVLEMYRALIYIKHMYLAFAGTIPEKATNDLENSWKWLEEAMRPIVDAAKHERYLKRYLEQKADWDLVDEQQRKIQADVEQKIEELKELLATERYNLMMLNMSQWLYSKEWRNFIPEKEQDKLNTPIVDYARKHYDVMTKELQQDIDAKIEMGAQDYFKLIAKMRRALDAGLFFGSLFDQQQRLAYREPWAKILDNIRDLQTNDYISQLLLESHSEDEIEQWLKNRNQPILESLIELRKQACKLSPYWRL
jgi:triphosphatase